MAGIDEAEELLDIYLSETEEVFRSAEESILSLEGEEDPHPAIDHLFRIFHSLKSSAAIVGLKGISEFSHVLESILERLRAGDTPVTRALVSYLLEGLDLIRRIGDRGTRGEDEASRVALNGMIEQAGRFLPGESEALDTLGAPPGPSPPLRPTGPSYYRIGMVLRKDLFHLGHDPILILRSLSELGEITRVQADLSALPGYAQFSPYTLYISWQVELKTAQPLKAVEDVFEFVREGSDIRIEDVGRRYVAGVDISLGEQRLGEILVEKGHLSPKQMAEAVKGQKRLGQILQTSGRISQEQLKEAVTLQERSRAVYRKISVRVEVEKINRLIGLAEEIGIGLSKAWSLLGKEGGGRQGPLAEALVSLARLNREFQERLSRIRMFPLEGTFQRFLRMIRDLALEQNKKVKVVTKGMEVELDKELLEHIADPLKHLVRNCVDHGIEPPEERAAKGKPPTGLVEMEAVQREGRVILTLRDDGRGIDLEAVRARAQRQGLIREGEDPGREALLGLIFKPGFSTREVVTELSGRGVGLDVVATQIEKLGGSVEVRTTRDEGTSFCLSLPLTLELMDVLEIAVQGRTFLVPLRAVLGVERFEQARVRGLGPGHAMIPFRGEFVSLCDLCGLYGIAAASPDRDYRAVVFLNTGKRVLGVPVEEGLESYQVVVKTLEKNFRGIRGVTGASLLGDGTVSLVLDPVGIEEMLLRSPRSGGES